jgi:ribosomal protein S18 acetylase RimI-like enzyme
VESDVTIRSAMPEDIQRAAALGAEIVRLHHATDPKRFFLVDNIEEGYAWWLGQEVGRPEAVILLAEREGQVVGYTYGVIAERDWGVLLDRHGIIHDLFVVESARRGGVGRALVAAMIRRLEALGAPQIVLHAMVQNEPAQRLAASFGFRPTMLEMTRQRG